MHFCAKCFDHIDSIRCSLYFNIDLYSVLPAFSIIAFCKKIPLVMPLHHAMTTPYVCKFLFSKPQKPFSNFLCQSQNTSSSSLYLLYSTASKMFTGKNSVKLWLFKKINVAYKQKHDFFFPAFKMRKLLGLGFKNSLFATMSLIRNSYNGHL